MLKELEVKKARYKDLMFEMVRQANELWYNSLIDTEWNKAIGDYHRLETTLMQLGIVLEDIVATFKILNKARKP